VESYCYYNYFVVMAQAKVSHLFYSSIIFQGVWMKTIKNDEKVPLINTSDFTFFFRKLKSEKLVGRNCIGYYRKESVGNVS
jgi:hypothetical protein